LVILLSATNPPNHTRPLNGNGGAEGRSDFARKCSPTLEPYYGVTRFLKKQPSQQKNQHSSSTVTGRPAPGHIYAQCSCLLASRPVCFFSSPPTRPYIALCGGPRHLKPDGEEFPRLLKKTKNPLLSHIGARSSAPLCRWQLGAHRGASVLPRWAWGRARRGIRCPYNHGWK